MPINEHLAAAPRGGMITRSKETLEPGLVVFKLGHRFDGSARQDDHEVISKPWWFSQAVVELICRAANSANENLADVFRRFGAVAKRWGGSGDLIVKAKIAKPVIAYIGPGTIQDFRGKAGQELNNRWDMPLWVPSPAIPQIYIPLAKRGDKASSVAGEAFTDVYVVPIDKWDDDYCVHAPKDKWKM